MKEFLVCEWAMSYGISLNRARRFTEEERKEYADWYKDFGFVGLDDMVQLDELDTQDLEEILDRPLNEPDGEFNGCTNQAYIILKEEWDELIEKNSQKGILRKAAELESKIQVYKDTIEQCERNKLYTDDEAKRKRIEWNNLMNEGGEGYIPHFYTFTEYEWAKKKLAELTGLK